MDKKFIKIDPFHIDTSLVKEVVHFLKNGGVIGYPTETFYGLGGDATNENVIQQIYRIKGRDPHKPLLILVSRVEEIYPLVLFVSPEAKIMMEHFWPGPLTLVFRSSQILPKSLTGENNKVGIRISPDPVCQALLRHFEKPLISTSANPAGKRPAESALQVLKYFGERLGMIVDGGERKSILPSTVVDVSENFPKVIRKGLVDIKKIQNLIGKIDG